MTKRTHFAFVALLVAVGILSGLIIGARGTDYYLTADKERPFHSDHELLKPTGSYGHGYGVIGSLMTTLGVVMYSTRNRVRRFSGMGSVRHYLEFHIFMCLTGPLLVLYHTTFEFGGLVAVSFWSMVAVVRSGLIGRYFYVQIPKGIHGSERISVQQRCLLPLPPDRERRWMRRPPERSQQIFPLTHALLPSLQYNPTLGS